jgi:hypothetical protein
MRQVFMMTVLAVAAMTALQSLPARAQYLHCASGWGCVPATQAGYNACFQLALARGLTVSVGDKRNLDWFIYYCLAGKVRR